MIQPNFDLLLWVILITILLRSILKIVAGATGMKKETKYGGGDVIAGIIILILMAIVLFS